MNIIAMEMWLTLTLIIVVRGNINPQLTRGEIVES